MRRMTALPSHSIMTSASICISSTAHGSPSATSATKWPKWARLMPAADWQCSSKEKPTPSSSIKISVGVSTSSLKDTFFKNF